MKKLMLQASFLLLCFFTASNGFGQTITGVVEDAQSNEPLPSVNILIKGTNNGTSTDLDGNYSLNVSSLNDTLLVSFIGYERKEVPINGREQVNISLTRQVLSTGELVVTAFGLTRERKALSYSTQGVNSEQLTEAREINAVDALAGKVAGLTITQ